MAIPYRTAKFKSTNILAIVILGPTAKFNCRQYFRLYGTCKFYHGVATDTDKAMAARATQLLLTPINDCGHAELLLTSPPVADTHR
jgi:hypothetical protein